MVEPTTDSCRKNTRFRSAGGTAPLVAPQTTIVPPGFSARSECAQVASPTVSMTASTRSGSRAPDSKAWSAPSSTRAGPLGLAPAGGPDPVARGPAEQDQRRGHAAAGALDQHGRARLTGRPGRTASGRRSGRRSAGTRPARSSARPAWAPGCAAARPPARRRCRRSAPTAATGAGRASRRRRHGSPMTACTTTSLPSSSTPAASQPRIIGSRSAGSPTPRSDQTSWWLSAAARTVTVVQPSGGTGSACSPELQAGQRVIGVRRAAVTANIGLEP